MIEATAIAVQEKPILFSGAMVKAILEGRKTQTRRVVSPHNCHWGSAPTEYWKHADFSKAWRDGQKGEFRGKKYVVTGRGDGEYLHVPCHVENEGECKWCDEWGKTGTSHRLWPNFGAVHTWQQTPEPGYTPPASRLWVRETFALQCNVEDDNPPFSDGRPIKRFDNEDESGWLQPHYRATDPTPKLTCPENERHNCGSEDICAHPWQPSIHMPRWASRLTLEIVSVKVERVQDISEDDAISEGIVECPIPADDEGPNRVGYMIGPDDGKSGLDVSPRDSFRELWDSINSKRDGGKYAWANNPWVWAITFKRI